MKRASSESDLPQVGTYREAIEESLRASARSLSCSGEGQQDYESGRKPNASSHFTDNTYNDFDDNLFVWSLMYENRDLLNRSTAAFNLAEIIKKLEDDADASGEPTAPRKKWVTDKDEYFALVDRARKIMLKIGSSRKSKKRFYMLLLELERSLNNLETKIIVDSMGELKPAFDVFQKWPKSKEITALQKEIDDDTELGPSVSSIKDEEHTNTKIKNKKGKIKKNKKVKDEKKETEESEERYIVIKPNSVNGDLIKEGFILADWAFPKPVTLFLNPKEELTWWTPELAKLRSEYVRARRQHQRYRRRKTKDETFEEVDAQLNNDFRSKRKIYKQAVKTAKAEYRQAEVELPPNLKIEIDKEERYRQTHQRGSNPKVKKNPK